MPSIRRTLSPVHVGAPFSPSSSPSQKSISKHNNSSHLTADPKGSRRGPWRRPFLAFFLVGFLLDGVSFVEIVKEEEDFNFVARKLIIVVTPSSDASVLLELECSDSEASGAACVVDIVVEGNAASFETWEILRKAGVMYRHLVSKRVQYATEVKSLDGTLMRRVKD
ncbi:hypothetical protein HID58_066041 [Brassica napus]|uniref:Uncharacterized protein n=1 Tax=Brassica napus TaxID=3708 RepID=A0ABQ7ZF01_BRANA|nr:hypothetical protein HID58_066041 [Brassica napus]